MLRQSIAVLGGALATGILTTGVAFAAAAPAIPTAFNPTIVQALQAMAGKTRLALNAPTLLPGRSSGYLTATTAAVPNAYQVTVWDTRIPLHVNNPATLSQRVPGNPVARFGAVRLAHPLPSQGAPNYLTGLERHNPVWVEGAAHAASGTVNLGDGIQAVRYPVAGQTQLDWAEGDWTIQVTGPSSAWVEQAAVPVVRFLHTYYLPPYPGLYAVRLDGRGPTAITSIDWMRGSVLSYVTNDHASATNPVATGGMAVSWRRWAPPSSPPATPTTTPAFAATTWRFLQGRQVVPAVPRGFTDAAQHLTFTPAQYQPVEGFVGQLHGHPFVLDFYAQSRVGLFVGVQYNHRPVYFGYGPSAVFDLLNFTGDSVVLGSPAAGQYMAVNLMTGQQTTNPQTVVPLKGYRGLGVPRYVLGLKGHRISPVIPYPAS